LHEISRMMNDFQCVDNSARLTDGRGWNDRFTTTDAADDHDAMLEYIRLMIEGKWDQKFVVVGHHAPSRLSTHPRYAHEAIMNGGYSSELDNFILDHPQIRLWTHGHTHEDFDYCIGSTQILCNPRGYINYEERADRWQLKTVEV